MEMGTIEHILLLFLSFIIKILTKNHLLILNYHRVLVPNDIFFSSDLDIDTFTWQIKLLKKYLKPLPLIQAIELMNNNNLPRGAVVVTFDDGYKDNLENALPILQEQLVPATFFIASSFLNGGIMWNDVVIESIKASKKKRIDFKFLNMGQCSLSTKEEKLNLIEKIIGKVKYKNLNERNTLIKQINQVCDAELPRNLMMTDSELSKLAQSGMEIGGHTALHPILNCETDQQVIDEISQGKKYLETLLDRKIVSFAYPNGKLGVDYQAKHAEMVKKSGFTSALSTDWGLNNSQTNLYHLKRFTPWDKTPNRFLFRICRLFILKSV